MQQLEQISNAFYYMKETRLKGALFHLYDTLVRKKTTGIKKKNKKRPVVARGRNGARY